MEGPLYSNIRQKLKTNLKGNLAPFSFLGHDLVQPEERDRFLEQLKAINIKITFYNDLKSLLKREAVLDIIEGLFELEQCLNMIENNPGIDARELPSLKTFYQQLAPLLLRSFWENGVDRAKQAAKTQDHVDKLWKEALRIAIEEEVYVWQEEILN